MNKLTGAIYLYFSNLPERLRAKKLIVCLVFIAISAIMFVGMSRVKSDSTVESWFETDDPTFVAYNAYHAQFGSEDGLVIVYRPNDGDVFSFNSLELIRKLRDELYYHRAGSADSERTALDHIVRVDTLVNVPVLTVEGDTLVSRPLVGDTVPAAPSERERIRKIAQDHYNIPLRYFSQDMRYGAIIVDTDFGAIPCDYDEEAAASMSAGDITTEELSFDAENAIDTESPCFKPTDVLDYEALNAAIKRILYKPEYAEHFEYFPVGNTPESEYQRLQQEEMALLYLTALLIMIALLWFLFRSFSAVVWAMLIVFLTSTWTLGVSGFFGLTITPFIILTAFLLLTVSMADAVHLMSSYLFFRKEGCGHGQALAHAYKKASVACLLTTVTTMIGLGALCFTDIVPVRQVGIMGAIGVAIAFLLTLYLLPVLLDLWSPVGKKVPPGGRSGGRPEDPASGGVFARYIPDARAYLQTGLEKIVPAVEKRPVSFVVFFAAVFALCLYGVTQARVDTDLLSMYEEDSKYPRSVGIIDEKLAGSSRMSIYMDIGESMAVKDPFVLRVVEELQQTFENKFEKYVVTTSSIVDLVKDTYQKLNQGQADKYVIPPDKSQLGQTLYMFNNADPEQRKRLVDDNYQKANVTITLLNASSYEYNAVFADMQREINASLARIKSRYPDARVSITGFFVLEMKLAEYLTLTALSSFSVAFVVINIALFVIFGSFKAGLISIIPNVIPSFLVVGLMGLLDIPLDFFAIMLAPIVIGISVDDTIHFLTHYRMQYPIDRDIRKAIGHTLKEAGQGLVFTTLILGLGFGILSLSFTPGVAKLGTFGSLAVFAGLINDLFLFPALIMLFKLKSGGVEESGEAAYKGAPA